MATITKSIGTTARDYSTINAWEAALGAASGGAGNDAVGNLYNDSAFDENPRIDNTTPDTIVLTAPESERHDGTGGTGARNVASTSGRWFFVTLAKPTVVEWFEMDGNGNSTSTATPIVYINATPDGRLRNCLLHNYRNTTGATGIYPGGASAGVSVTNTMLYYCNQSSGGGGMRGIYTDVTGGGDVYMYNLTFHSWKAANSQLANGIQVANNLSSVHIKNCVITDVESTGTVNCFAFAGTNNDSENNLSTDDTADDGGGSNHLINQTAADLYVSTVAGSEDLHLKEGANAIGAGLDLGTTPAGVNIDIDGRDRDAEGDTWDMGADQYVSPGTVVSVPIGTLTLTGYPPVVSTPLQPNTSYAIYQNDRIELFHGSTLVWSMDRE